MQIKQEKYLIDGIYDVTDIPFVLDLDMSEIDCIEDIKNKQVLEFINFHKDVVIASAHETSTIIFLAIKTVKLDKKK